MRFQVAIEVVLEFQQGTRLCEGVAPSPRKGHTLCTVAEIQEQVQQGPCTFAPFRRRRQSKTNCH